MPDGLIVLLIFIAIVIIYTIVPNLDSFRQRHSWFSDLVGRYNLFGHFTIPFLKRWYIHYLYYITISHSLWNKAAHTRFKGETYQIK